MISNHFHNVQAISTTASMRCIMIPFDICLKPYPVGLTILILYIHMGKS